MAALKFLGASVRNYGISLGWNGQESRLQVSLVEDPKDGDLFLLSNGFIAEGNPVLFSHGTISFGGLIQSWNQTNDFGGNPTYNVTIVDPRIFFDGIQLILSDYTNTISVKNLVNIYGYLEDRDGFGGAQKNDAGIPFNLIRSSLLEMAYNPQPSNYCGGINYMGIDYNIDLSELPTLPDDYRIAAQSMSLTDLITEVCDITSSAFFVRLYFQDNKWYIKVLTQSRSQTPLKGALRAYVNATTGVAAKDTGVELVNEVTTKYLVGGKKTDVFIVNRGAGEDGTLNPTESKPNATLDNTIWYYFGTDLDGNAVFTGQYDTFNIDARNVQHIDGLRPIYNTNIYEIRAALTDYDTWLEYIKMSWPFEFIPNEEGDETAPVYIRRLKSGSFTEYEVVEGSKTYKHDGVNNPHFMKAIELKIDTISDDLSFWQNVNDLPNFAQFNPGVLQKWFEQDRDTKQALTNTEELYNLVKNFADEYYGRKFMVRVPEVEGAVEPNSIVRKFSHLPVSAGYVPEEEWEDGIANKILPPEYLKFTTEDNRIVCYVRFDDAANLDISLFDKKDLVYTLDKSSIFIRCEVDENYVFEDYANFTNPRAVITLPSPIYRKKVDTKLIDQLLTIVSNNILEQDVSETSLASMNKDNLINLCVDRKYVIDVFNTPVKVTSGMKLLEDATEAEVREFATNNYREEKKQLEQALPIAAFSTSLNSEFSREVIVPNMAAVPLESQVEFYGPWISSVGNGKVEYEQDENLVPWNFGSYVDMNACANSMVNGIAGNMTWSEAGTIEVPGIPLLSPGDILIVGGPMISDMEVAINDNRITTTYRMSSWTPRFGKVSRTIADKVQKLSKLGQQNLRLSRLYSTLKKIGTK